MISELERSPGFVVLASTSADQAAEVAALIARAYAGQVTQTAVTGCLAVTWAGLHVPDENTQAVLLALGVRSHGPDLSAGDAAELMRSAGSSRRREVLPPFAALGWNSSVPGYVAEADWLGFRHVYVAEGVGWSGFSSSARALAAGLRAELDREALAAQTLLGWQVGLRTPFAGVSKLAPGTRVLLSHGSLKIEHTAGAPVTSHQTALAAAVPRAAAIVRQLVEAQLDEHPDTILQLTGGQDSRILLGAIPASRRSSVEAMTLSVPGSADVEIAASLCVTQGMTHRLITLDGLEDLDPVTVHELCTAAAIRLDCAADPLAFVSLAWAESQLEQRPRLSGLGGEVARGFYYAGPTSDRPVTRDRVARLAKWRMFVNESVSRDALEDEFVRWANTVVVSDIFALMSAQGHPWLTATDEFYLWQRMQRWAGTLATATSFDRLVVNPMLDYAFLEICRSLPPRSKKNMRFLSRILLELDESLADLPLDGRPSPRVYAEAGLGSRATLAMTQATKVVRKVRQRLTAQPRPPVGAEVLAAKLSSYWQENPDELMPLAELKIFRPAWLDQVGAGQVTPDPASAAMLVNLITATSA